MKTGLLSISLNEIRVQVCIDYTPNKKDAYNIENKAFSKITDRRCNQLYGAGAQGVAHFIFELDHYPSEQELEELKQIVREGIIKAREEQ